ncbi:hypothetical protein [Cellulomonas sp. HD19AZ1]|uniref:YaaC family protein n=1 Tax=Cellulomonas sp. HD19AZ1 TaxID=2559593 RepID=UPI001070D453|nr:hypothetical protein [Cellulomonas sp. HD19AZ1]TFH68197.1 hypothetical protein E4A51_16920 [Cellulomonas sp. HD19AZ1]
MVRWFEMDGDRQTAWRAIRLTRSRLPDGTADSRRALYAGALEQAEQQFRAAASVGPESRPLNLFYGLSQAGRAIAAARTPDGQGISPVVSKHGLKVHELDALRPGDDVFKLQVRGEGGRDTSFGRLAWLTGSDSLQPEGVSLAAVWMMLPEVSFDFPIDGHHPTHLVDAEGDSFRLAVPDDDEDASMLRAAYPQLGSAELTDGNYGYTGNTPGQGTPVRRFQLPDAQRTLSNYRGSSALMPAWREGGGYLDPLLAWWVMLYALSMLARYRPVEWTRAIDVDKSPSAVWLEQLLDKALDAVPLQLHIALTGAHPGTR